ncbi:LysR family transcriptional regulator [Faecalitalea cylindroides]|uniref:LysR family transcriptional regulator n=1 Tax=Faecalitalea cylindroides TaxID=39483 RepID=UPI00195EB285|nr:LysR family transcriptional regulator [Faecalitalea cylindroides]MBM6652349.1 LysR family transcriptional regulator [Faecalitalea cylindroides]
MDFRLLEYFLAVAREQNITNAAESLHISQPALSTQLKNLEEELGKQLLIRGVKGSRKILLTEEGMILRKRAEEMLLLKKRTEEEISGSNKIIAGNVFIGTGETETVRLFAQVAKKLQKKYPDIRYNISSGNAEHVLEYLDKGIIDFGLLFREIDKQKYESIPVPIKDTWGVLMHKDSPLAIKESIQPQDLWDKPLIVPHQKGDDVFLNQWLQRDESQLHIAATYNLIFNASLLVDEGLGYALCYDKLINTQDSNLCFRPLYPLLEVKGYIVWKKYQVFSKAAELFLQYLRKILENKI